MGVGRSKDLDSTGLSANLINENKDNDAANTFGTKD